MNIAIEDASGNQQQLLVTAENIVVIEDKHYVLIPDEATGEITGVEIDADIVAELQAQVGR